MKQLMDLMVDGLSVPVTNRGRLYDLVVVGGGIVGLAAAMEAARAGMSTLVIERADFDDTGGAVQCVRCCPDTLGMLPVRKPKDLATTETECFDIEILLGKEVTSINDDEHSKVIGTDGGREYRARAILLSPGASYRRLGVPGEEDFIGANIHHCAGCEGPAYTGQEIVAIGSSDFGIEEALALADYASKVTVVEAGDHLMCNGELAEIANNHASLDVRLNSKVLEFKGDAALTDNRLRSLLIEDFHSGDIEALPAAAVFVFTGADPKTDFLWGVVELDPWGFVKTDRDFQTSMEGVYVAGDARSTGAMGAREPLEEGVAAVSAIRRFLAKTEVRNG